MAQIGAFLSMKRLTKALKVVIAQNRIYSLGAILDLLNGPKVNENEAFESNGSQ